MASRHPPPTMYVASKDGSKITPVMPNIPLSVASISSFGYAIATKVPPSEREVAAMKAAREAAESRKSTDSMDTIDRSKEDSRSQEKKKKKSGEPSRFWS